MYDGSHRYRGPTRQTPCQGLHPPYYNGLALFVNTKGAKCWHFRFSWADKQPRISLGTYPEISLRDARALRDIARALVAKGIDPRVHRQLERNARRLAREIA
ncbi:Arm DNA-binding domain-containing protein [Pseudomonas brassicacearum]|uniref:Arm DNA-binding domain-containing protein n=1 Tax=Pseudomonas brassicacearum TaxID=930166 RepID=UPI003D6A7583